MSIEFWRDLSISVVFFEIALLVLVTIVLVIFLYIFISRVLRAVGKGTAKVRSFSRRAARGAAKPLIATAAFVIGLKETAKAAIISLRQQREKAPQREKKTTPRKKTTMSIGMGALLGVLGGLAIGFLYAPLSGRDIRKSAATRTRKVTRKTEPVIGRARATLNWLRRGRKPVMAEGHR